MKSEVVKAVDLQRRSYELLRWVGTMVMKQGIAFHRAEAVASAAEAAREWLSSIEIPRRLRPDPDEVEGLANVFSSYLVTSFDLDARPGSRASSACGCYCDLCVRMVPTSNLRPKKLTDLDRKRARRLRAGYLRNLASAHGRELSERALERLLEDRALREPLALATYGDRLVARCQGAQDGPALLVLWRQFAWTPEGSPRKGFELTADAILAAEVRIAEAAGWVAPRVPRRGRSAGRAGDR